MKYSGALVLGIVAVLLAASGATAQSTARVFYLTLHPRQCLVAVPTKTVKYVNVVPCSNPMHRFEVYAVGRGGWGATPPPYAAELATARGVCLAAFQRLTGHPMQTTLGWQAYWPDKGAETTKYADRIICGLRTWPRFGPFGSGWHVR